MSSSVDYLQLPPLSLKESLCLPDVKHATHCMIYSSDTSSGISYALLQLRFDGLIGFAGGEVDVEDVTIEDIVEAMNREMKEEINYQLENICQNDWICSHKNLNSQYVLHFFAKQLSVKELRQLEATHMSAEHFPIESLGLFRVPIGGSDPNSQRISKIFLNNFLRQRFAGNARQQFIETIKKRSLLDVEDHQWFEFNDHLDNNLSDSGIEAKAWITAQLPVHLYHNEPIEVTYGLMIVRDNGLFDFIGSHHSVSEDNNCIIKTLNDRLKSDLNSHCLTVDSGSDVMTFNDGLTHVYCVHLNDKQFVEIETNFTNSDHFDKCFGIFRVPLKVRGTTPKANDYVNRFLKGFLNQNFVNNINSKLHLKSIYDKNY